MIKPHFWIFTDGSCGQGKDDIGAWAAFTCNDQVRKLLYGVAHPTTVSRCELIPIIEALRWVRRHAPFTTGLKVLICSDSEYTIRTLSGEYPAQKNNDLWVGLRELTKDMVIEYRYRERNTHPYTTLCDAVCSTLRKRTIAVADELLLDYKHPEDMVPVVELPAEMEDRLMGL